MYGDPWREVTLEELEELRTEAVVADRKSAVLRESARKVAMLSGIIGKFKVGRSEVFFDVRGQLRVDMKILRIFLRNSCCVLYPFTLIRS